RFRGGDRRRPPRREPRAPARPRAMVAPVAADDVHRPGDLGDRAPDGRGGRGRRQRRHARPAADRGRDLRRRGAGDPALRAGAGRWGSGAAAPVCSATGRDILRYLEVPRRAAAPVQIVTGPVPDSLAPGVTAPVRLVSTDVTPDANGSPVMPDVTGRTLRSA